MELLRGDVSLGSGVDDEEWCLLRSGRTLELEADRGLEGVTVSLEDMDALLLSESIESLGRLFSKGVMDLSSPRVNITESVSVMELLVSPFLEGEVELRCIVRFLKVFREERSESLTEGTGEGATGRPLCSRRR